MKRVVLLGSTGSIGTQVLEVIQANSEELKVVGLSAHANKKLFNAQVQEFGPQYSLLTSQSENPEQALSDLAQTPEADLIINAITGVAGLLPTYAAVKAGKKIALANKESMVMAGELLTSLAKKTGAEIIPIDSELSALLQIIGGGESIFTAAEDASGKRGGKNIQNFIEKVILTASGGPFRGFSRKQIQSVTPQQALQHPIWKMGEKISIDSATLMNKAFEIIEARWLFAIPPEKIEAVIHRQSIVHGLVEWVDSNISAVLSAPDMKIAIAYALFYPKRQKNKLSNIPRLSLSGKSFTFETPDYSIFEGPKLAHEVLQEGGILPAVFCLADEIAVKKFLKGEISFLGIYDFIKHALSKVKNMPLSIEALREVELRLN